MALVIAVTGYHAHCDAAFVSCAACYNASDKRPYTGGKVAEADGKQRQRPPEASVCPFKESLP